jgi:dCTP deaminase
MLMADTDIRGALFDGRIAVEPFDEAALQPASIDVRLGNHFVHEPPWAGGDRVWTEDDVVDPARDNGHHTITSVIPDGGDVVLYPGDFMLGHTVERISLSPKVASWVEGISSLGRLGLIVHSTAGFVDPGFSGQITLELGNVSRRPIRLRPGMRIAQMCFIWTLSASQRPYGPERGSKYYGQSGATRSLSHKDR